MGAHVWKIKEIVAILPKTTSRRTTLSRMNVGYAIVSLVGAVIAVDGIWMMASARFLLRIPRWNYPRNPAALRWMGAGATIGGAGIAAGSSVLAAYGPLSGGLDILAGGVLGMALCYAAAWWVSYRARRPVSN